MKILLLLALFDPNVGAFGQARFFQTPVREKQCTVINGATPGTQKSTDYGKTFNSCSGFTCNSGFTVSGSTCISSNWTWSISGTTNFQSDSDCNGTLYVNCNGVPVYTASISSFWGCCLVSTTYPAINMASVPTCQSSVGGSNPYTITSTCSSPYNTSPISYSHTP